jgi:hypothetical protein
VFAVARDVVASSVYALRRTRLCARSRASRASRAVRAAEFVTYLVMRPSTT